MCVTYSMPNDNIYNNVIKDTNMFDTLYPRLIPGDPATIIDVYTESKIITELLDRNEYASSVKNAMAVFSITPKDFNSFINGNTNVTWEYPRYWHGYLVGYNILFNFFDYTGVKIINLLFELVLIIGILKSMLDKNLKNYIIPFVMSLFFIHPEVIGFTLDYAPVFNVMLISVYILLKFKDKLFVNNNLIYYFMIIGMCTSFFDFLTFPLICLGAPLVFYLLLENNNLSLKEIIVKILLFACVWAIGYAGMWISKWIIASIVLNQNVVLNAFSVVSVRSSVQGVSRFDALFKNILIYNNNFYYMVIMGLVGIYYIIRLIKVKECLTVKKLKETIPLLLICITPFLWYILVSNHSYIHYWMTYRILFVFFFAIMCALEYLIMKNEVRDPTP